MTRQHMESRVSGSSLTPIDCSILAVWLDDGWEPFAELELLLLLLPLLPPYRCKPRSMYMSAILSLSI